MDKLKSKDILTRALEEILACPACGGLLTPVCEGVNCRECGAQYFFKDEILVLLPAAGCAQQSEREFRDSLAFDRRLNSEADILSEVSKHHSFAVMRERTADFASFVNRGEWVLDIGTGFAWHWRLHSPRDFYVLGIDFSMTNLKTAKRLLGENRNVLLVCADASALPVKNKSVFGAWSVQVFQHFPDEVFQKAKKELARVLKENYIMEIVNLNPAPVLKAASFLVGKKTHWRARAGSMFLNRFSGKELKALWRDFRIKSGRRIFYSELFFHPPRLAPSPYPLLIEKFMSRFDFIAAFFSRQIHLRIKSYEEN